MTKYKTLILNFDHLLPQRTFDHLLPQRVRSTGLPERDLAIVKRKPYTTVADGKEPKSVRKETFVIKTLTAHSNNGGRTGSGTEVPKWYGRLFVLSRLEKHQKARSLWALINERDLWAAAYQKLAASGGSLTPEMPDKGVHKGVVGDKTTKDTKDTIDGCSLKILDALRNSVYNGTYKFGITRRVFIPKPQAGRKKKPLNVPLKNVPKSLGVPEFRHRVVQEVIRSILETVFEPRFHPSNHGFRPGRSQHTCMGQILRDFKGTKWFIEGDISKCFHEINHYTMRKELEKNIQDKRFVALVTKVLMPDGKLEKLEKWDSIDIPLPQGGQEGSSVLFNIALNKFDQFIARLKNPIDRGQNPEYIRAYKFLRLNYVRYADDFLIGIIGPRALAERVRSLVQRFLKQRLQLRLNEEKIRVTRAKGNKVPLLGFLIQTIEKTIEKGPSKRTVKRSGDLRLRLLVDSSKVIKALTKKKFCTRDGSPRPCFTYFQDPQSYTVGKAKSIIQAIDNYYQIANNRRAFISRVVYIIRDSIARVFAAKFKLRTRGQVYTKGGKDLSRPIDATTAKEAQLKGSMPKIPYIKYGTMPKPTGSATKKLES
jgi:retron-type reverse transcriptase